MALADLDLTVLIKAEIEIAHVQGHSPSVKFPRILGIEACGIVEDAPGGEFSKGAIVATAMGGMGRQIEGGYAEYTCVPAKQVQVGSAANMTLTTQ